MDDNSIMPYGKHKGEKMANVPASYLLWLYENDKCSGDIKRYIIENKSDLEKELKQIK
jgi:uncharacterized protein (DUF3820 family)